jgi:hypothetical protein
MKVQAAILLVVTGLLCAAIGCPIKITFNEENTTDMGSHHVTVRPGNTFTCSSSSSGEGNEIYHYTCGDVSIVIHNEELMVNEEKYGKINVGAPILVDNGKVYVSKELRQGKPMSEDEIIEYAIVKESTEEIADFEVTVRPGAQFTSSSNWFGKHTLKVGKTKVIIKKKKLYVNGQSYGNLTKGDTILIEHSRVYVSGKLREVIDSKGAN